MRQSYLVVGRQRCVLLLWVLQQLVAAAAEFAGQLRRVQLLVERIPQVVMEHLLSFSLDNSRSELLRLHAEFIGFHGEYIRQKVYTYTAIYSCCSLAAGHNRPFRDFLCHAWAFRWLQMPDLRLVISMTKVLSLDSPEHSKPVYEDLSLGLRSWHQGWSWPWSWNTGWRPWPGSWDVTSRSWSR